MPKLFVNAVRRLTDGTAQLVLGPKAGEGGNRVMIVLNPPTRNFDVTIGTEVLIGRMYLMVGGLKWAERINGSDTRIRLLRPEVRREGEY